MERLPAARARMKIRSHQSLPRPVTFIAITQRFGYISCRLCCDAAGSRSAFICHRESTRQHTSMFIEVTQRW